jgi:ActR/RegA family two-component response regulator
MAGMTEQELLQALQTALDKAEGHGEEVRGVTAFDLAMAMGKSPSYISRQLKIGRHKGLIKVAKVRRWNEEMQLSQMTYVYYPAGEGTTE